MSTNPNWSRATQINLIAELQGFWAADLWDMHHSPSERLVSQCQATPPEVPVQICGSQWGVEVSVLEEVLQRRLAKHSRNLPCSPHDPLAEQHANLAAVPDGQRLR